jgi:chemotaxis protein MotB
MADEKDGQTIVIKKINKGVHSAHGGAWKVAYADFVTAMMAFFLVMWIIGLSQPTKEGIQRYFQDPLRYLMGSDSIDTGLFNSSPGTQAVDGKKSGGYTDSSKQGGAARVHALAVNVQKYLEPFASDIFGFKAHPDKVQFAITAQNLFAPGSALLKPDSEALLSKVAEILKTLDAYIMVEAHTDDIPVDSPTYPTNWELSAARAAVVTRYFIEGHHFDPSKLTPMGAGEFRPIADNSTPEGRAKNRRIEIYVIPDRLDRYNFRNTAGSESK